MLRPSDIFVDGQKLVYRVPVERLFVVFAVGVSQKIPAAAHKRVQCVRFARRLAAAAGAYGVDKALVLFQGTHSVGAEIHVVRKQNGQILFRHGHDSALVAVNHRYRRAPISLPRNQPVAQTVVDLKLALALLRQLFHNGASAFRA